jgi:nitroimidazol reductase NimA-like FMN-containing flavoprotein (pyridoxamine 5'-phosphate oxidase superfamily)
MRRKKYEISSKEAALILGRGSYGVLAVAGDEGYPYAVPLCYVYLDGKLYFHSATAGHKLDAITRDAKVSFCVIDTAVEVPEELTTYYRSVIAFGRARIIEDDGEKRLALEALATKYAPDLPESNAAEIEKSWRATTTFVVEIDHLTAKQSSELSA